MRTLSREEARSFYDAFGAKQDAQGFYERPALEDLCAHAGFERAESVFELGCGTGRFAEELLSQRLPPTARYVGVDLSSTMVELAQARLARFGDRVRLRQTDGSPQLAEPDAGFDRFVTTYVLDLLSVEDIRGVLAEARRLLAPGGLLCVAGLTPGRTPLARVVSFGWEHVHRLRPALVGGCRALQMREHLPEVEWKIHHAAVVSPYGLASEIVIAEPSASA